MAPSIEIRTLSYQYFEGAPSVLTNVTLHVPSGSCTAILGSAGAGKTTLLQILSGVIGSQFTTGKASGSVSIGGNEYVPIPSRVLFPEVGYLMQDASLQLSGIKETVAEELGFTLDNLDIGGEERTGRISALLADLGLLHLASRKPTQLSGGELQRTALASILVANPSLLLLDEPVNALDSLAQQRMVKVTRSLKGTATVIVADAGIAFPLAVADLFVVMDAGTILFSGNRREFLDSLESFAAHLPVSLWSEILRRNGTTATDRRIRRILTT
jgi:energy-coupling factor transporter ATP-binding protein EcfA2